MRKLSEAQIVEGRWVAQHGWFSIIPARTAAAMQRAGYIYDTKTSDSCPVWRFTPEGLYAWAKQAPAASTWPRISRSYIEDAEREAHLEDLERTAARICPKYQTAVMSETIVATDIASPEIVERVAAQLEEPATCGHPVHQPVPTERQDDYWKTSDCPHGDVGCHCASASAPTLNDFENGCDEQPRCAFCTNTYGECACEYPPASVALERKLAERRAAGGATFEQRAEIVRLAAGRNVSAELEPAVTAATASDGVLAYELAQDTISQLLRAPRTDLDFSNRVLAYRRQNGWSPRLTARQSRRLNKKMRRELAR